jgi:large subunit ribosomal protein L15
MQLNSLIKIKTNSKKRVGRGIGSGRGKTSARGYKGQKSRGKVPAAFIGGSLPLYKKLPFVRGWGNTKGNSLKPALISLDDLNKIKAKSTVTITSLVEAGLVDAKSALKRGVKVLAKGELKNALNLEIPVSKKVREIVESLGGKVV